MVEGSTTPEESSSNFRGKLLFKRGPNCPYSPGSRGQGGERNRHSLWRWACSFLVSPPELPCTLRTQWKQQEWPVFSIFEILMSWSLHNPDSIILTLTIHLLYVIIISQHFSCVLWTTSGVAFGCCSKCLQDTAIIYTSKFSPKLGSWVQRQIKWNHGMLSLEVTSGFMTLNRMSSSFAERVVGRTEDQTKQKNSMGLA